MKNLTIINLEYRPEMLLAHAVLYKSFKKLLCTRFEREKSFGQSKYYFSSVIFNVKIK